MHNDLFIQTKRYFEKDKKIQSLLLTDPTFNHFKSWIQLQSQFSETLVETAIVETVKNFRVAVFHNPVNPSSFAHFLRKDTVSKTMDVHFRSEKKGFLQGFITKDSLPSHLSSKPLHFETKEGIYWVVEENSKFKLSKHFDESSALQVATNQKGNFITSDIDLVMIASKDNYGRLCSPSLGFGELTELEYDVIMFANKTFQNLISELFPHFVNYQFQLFTHGPSNRFSRSKLSHLHFPMKYYLESGIKGSFGNENEALKSRKLFFNHLEKLQENGYKTELNSLWGLNTCA